MRPPYTLNDMARDAVGLMDGLGIGAAHVVGASMGGMIAQIVAAEHPDRVRSLTSIMSSPAPVMPRPKVLRALLRPAPRDRDQAIRRMHDFFRLVGGSGYPPTDAELKVEGRPLLAPQLPAGRLHAPARSRSRAGRAACHAAPRARADARPARR